MVDLRSIKENAVKYLQNKSILHTEQSRNLMQIIKPELKNSKTQGLGKLKKYQKRINFFRFQRYEDEVDRPQYIIKCWSFSRFT